ncbi:MAG: hypothetical protein IKU34_06280 [Clostridia bacterium]|nr:hypothetical protein [Clostridia bacterium]
MSRSKHHQGVHQWNPPPMPKDGENGFDQPQNIASATECTGLSAQPAKDWPEAQALSELYAIHQMKPQGNIGKGNPNNAPSEIAFHRAVPEPTPLRGRAVPEPTPLRGD